MIKRTLYFGNPARISIKQQQLLVNLEYKETSVPIEDIGVIILDHYQIQITHHVFNSLLDNNAAIITCNEKHHPIGLLLNLDGNTLQSEKFQAQIQASEPLKKQLWQQTIKAKIRNQHFTLRNWGYEGDYLYKLKDKVQSGDSTNVEAQASRFYWNHLFDEEDFLFLRERYGDYPNNLLNYGYAILRATVARGLVASGLLPTLGIFHRNRYNAYCLADDIMEPYRPYVDNLVKEIMLYYEPEERELSKTIKSRLLGIPAMDIFIDDKKSPLMVGLQRTTASLASCFEGSTRKIIYPEILKEA
jgi:CRISPR-associated protein Cas1